MKHLKHYNEEHKLKGFIWRDLKDICLELKDEGFKVDIDRWKHNIDITKSQNQRFPEIDFKYSEVSEVIERLKDYLSQNNWKGGSIYYPEWRREGDGVGSMALRNGDPITPNLTDTIKKVRLHFTQKHLYPPKFISSFRVQNESVEIKDLDELWQSCQDVFAELIDEGHVKLTRPSDNHHPTTRGVKNICASIIIPLEEIYSQHTYFKKPLELDPYIGLVSKYYEALQDANVALNRLKEQFSNLDISGGFALFNNEPSFTISISIKIYNWGK